MMTSVLALSMPGIQEWLIIGVIALLLFGGKRLPELGKSLGKGISGFKKGLKEAGDEIAKEEPTTPATPAVPPAAAGPTRFDPQTGEAYKFDPATGKPLNGDKA